VKYHREDNHRRGDRKTGRLLLYHTPTGRLASFVSKGIIFFQILALSWILAAVGQIEWSCVVSAYNLAVSERNLLLEPGTRSSYLRARIWGRIRRNFDVIRVDEAFDNRDPHPFEFIASI
jgi:hypothetical protein